MDIYEGMWKNKPKPLSKMKRAELVRNLQNFRDAWERVTTRNQDLSDERLNEETVVELRKLIKYYYSDTAKRQAEDWLDLTDSDTESYSDSASEYEYFTGKNGSCVKSAQKKYTTRPGPPYPAQDCKWKRKRGNNKDLYKSEPNKNGVFRWKKVK